MRLAATSNLCAILIWLFADGQSPDTLTASMKTGAQFQFMHAMATFACATFMNIGAEPARFAPPFFLAGSLIFAGSCYGRTLGLPEALQIAAYIGGAGVLVGWAILIWTAGRIDC